MFLGGLFCFVYISSVHISSWSLCDVLDDQPATACSRQADALLQPLGQAGLFQASPSVLKRKATLSGPGSDLLRLSLYRSDRRFSITLILILIVVAGEITSVRPLRGWNPIRLPALCLCGCENKASDANGREENSIRTRRSR